MYCKKCKYHSFDHVSACPKCGTDWEETRKALYLNWITSSGYNWLNADALAAKHTTQTAHAFTDNTPPRTSDAPLPDADGIFLDVDTLIPPTPPAHSDTKDAGLDVGLLPELNFGLEEPTPVAPPTAPIAPTPTADLTPDIYLEDFEPIKAPAPEVVTTAPVQEQTQRAASRSEELFIPELEEMLAPLTDELSGNQGRKIAKFDQEDDIVLDFGPSSDDDIIVIEDTGDLDILSIDEPKK